MNELNISIKFTPISESFPECENEVLLLLSDGTIEIGEAYHKWESVLTFPPKPAVPVYKRTGNLVKEISFGRMGDFEYSDLESDSIKVIAWAKNEFTL